MALDTHIDDKLKKMPGVGASAYSTSGANATITGTLSARQLEELQRVAEMQRHEVVVLAGVVTVRPRS